MKINENTLLEGHKVVLFPYNANYLPRYHEWMKHHELQHLTDSEPLTLEQEYDILICFFCFFLPECTFIILDKQRWADPSIEEEQFMVGDLEIMIAGDAQCTYLKSNSKSKAEQISTVSLCCGLYISVISCVYLFISEHYISLVFYRAQLQRQGHWEGGETHDDGLQLQ
uniref:N-acetyltransferase domain-containing protein n=1 Tax=Monopterus albus TaxID=43700 RepID=A0A3Q3QJQ3_MONAL